MHVRSTSAAASTRRTPRFLEREVWDLDATPGERFPLLLHYHPIAIYRRQLIKQAVRCSSSARTGSGCPTATTGSGGTSPARADAVGVDPRLRSVVLR